MSDMKEQLFNLEDSSLPDLMRLAEEIPGGFFIYHAHDDESLIYANKAMVRIFGCDTMEEFKELTGNSFKGIVYEEDYEQIDKSIWNQIDQSFFDMDYVEYRIKRKDGSIRWVQDYGHYRETEEYGGVFYVFIDDATERIRKRDELSEQLDSAASKEQQYKRAILNEKIAFFEVNVSTDTFITSSEQEMDGQVMNSFDSLGMPHFAKLSDYVNYCIQYVDEEERRGYLDFFNPGRLTECFKEGEFEQSFEGGTVDLLGRNRRNRYLILLRKDEKSDDIIAMLIIKNITEQAEKQQIFETALRQANASSIARKTFLSNLSHDIRTPLNSIMGIAELMRDNEYSREKTVEFMAMIRNSCNQLLNMVMESFNVTRMDMGKSGPENVPCNLGRLIAFVERQFMPEFTSKKVTLSISRNNVAHEDVMTDRVGVFEIISHLMDNALKYTDEGGKVDLSVVELPQEQEGIGCYRITVQDSGIGMSEKKLEYILDLFEGKNTEVVRELLGEGLGFYIIKNNLDLLGGKIEIKSEAGEGSVFAVTLKFKLQDESQKNPVYAGRHIVDSEKLRGCKVLLVEDNRMNMEIEQELLERSGFFVDTAENGQEALDKLITADADAYDVILMDTRMPVMDGYEAARNIRRLEDKRKADIPIIAVSANVFTEDKQKTEKAGMNAHCPKPIDMEYLRELIESVL